jgi:pectate lyase
MFQSIHKMIGGIGGGLALVASLSALTTFAAEPVPPAPRPLLAFPSAEGFGALATGGRGGEVYHVTNLRDAGPGSFRDAVSKGPRIVVFDVGGIVRLLSNVTASSDLTLAGQTAPGEGIAIYGHSVSFSGFQNVIVRFLRFRQGVGGDRAKGSLILADSSNMIFDHVSIEWGRWDNLNVTQGSHAITFQYCLIGESLEPQRFGALFDSATDITLSHNLWIDNQSRNPKAKGAIQYINNVVYNWGTAGLVGGHTSADHWLDVIGNYFIKGPSSNDRFVGQFTATDRVYQAGNYVDLLREGQLNGRPVVAADFADAGGAPTLLTQPRLHPPVPVRVDTAEDAYTKIVAGAGCSLHRDSVDKRLIADLTSLSIKGRIIRDEATVHGIGTVKGGPAPVSTVRDGLSDAWKISHGLDPQDPKTVRGDYNRDGYNNLEDYLNELAGDGPAR